MLDKTNTRPQQQTLRRRRDRHGSLHRPRLPTTLTRLPTSASRLIANIKLRHAPPNDGWLQLSRNGRYLYVGRSGDVINTRTQKIVAYLRPLRATADILEIDWRRGGPVARTSRYGVGYRP
jgi:hypothetical protein